MYLSIVQVAESFGVAERVVEEWVRREGLPATPDRGGLLFDRARVAAWAATHGRTARTGFLAPTKGALATDLDLARLLEAGGIRRAIDPAGVPDAIRRVLRSRPGLSGPHEELLASWLDEPAGVHWAPVGHGLGLSHFASRVTLGADAAFLALLFLDGPFAPAEPTPDGVPVTRLFFFVPPSHRAHLDLLGRLSRRLLQGPLLPLVQRGAPDAEIVAALEEGRT